MIRMSSVLVPVMLAGVLSVSTADASLSLTYNLDRSNTFANAPAGDPYATVILSTDSSASDTVTIDIQINNVTSVYTKGVKTGSNPFGMDKFYFNTSINDADQELTITSMPADWEVSFKGKNVNDFGTFMIEEKAKGKDTSPHVVFTIQGDVLSSLTEQERLNAFIQYSTVKDDSAGKVAAFFAAHVKNFNKIKGLDGKDAGSHFVGGSESTFTHGSFDLQGVPEPSTIVLLLSGAVPLAAAGLRRRRRASLIAA